MLKKFSSSTEAPKFAIQLMCKTISDADLSGADFTEDKSCDTNGGAGES